MKNKKEIKEKLLSSLETGEGIYTKATSMQSGRHHWYLTGDKDNPSVNIYGSGRGWCDQSSYSSLTLNEAVSQLWRKRASIS